jgi:uncharacterized metal-binding protein
MHMPSLLKAARAGFFLFAWSGCLFGCVNAVFAATPAPSSSPAADDAAPTKNAGTIEGRITRIDYHSGVMVVDCTGGARKTYEVLVVPGTSIQGAKDFHTIADLKKGEHVQVLLSQHGSTFTAQIIRLL